MLLQCLPRERKQSVLVASYEAWNDESIAQAFRDLSPSVSAILDTAWNGHLKQLEELLEEEENLEKVKSNSLRDCYGRTPLHLGKNKFADNKKNLFRKPNDGEKFKDSKLILFLTYSGSRRTP